MADDKKEAAPAAPKKPMDMGKIFNLGFLVINLVVMGGGTYMLYDMKLAYKRPTITEESEKSHMEKTKDALREDNPVYYSFEPFVANLDGKPKRIVTTKIQVEMLGEDGYEEAIELTGVARDRIIRILNKKNLRDIETLQGKLFLKDQIQTALNSLYKRGAVKEVYFNEFLVQ